MTLSGMAWGIYSLRGIGSMDALGETARNFIKTFPFITLLTLLNLRQHSFDPDGIYLAVISGAITSGLGYTIWYLAIKNLSQLQAAVVQLSVPVFAAIGGVIFVNEIISWRLTLSSIIILGGILLVILSKR